MEGKKNGHNYDVSKALNERFKTILILAQAIDFADGDAFDASDICGAASSIAISSDGIYQKCEDLKNALVKAFGSEAAAYSWASSRYDAILGSISERNYNGDGALSRVMGILGFEMPIDDDDMDIQDYEDDFGGDSEDAIEEPSKYSGSPIYAHIGYHVETFCDECYGYRYVNNGVAFFDKDDDLIMIVPDAKNVEWISPKPMFEKMKAAKEALKKEEEDRWTVLRSKLTNANIEIPTAEDMLKTE